MKRSRSHRTWKNKTRISSRKNSTCVRRPSISVTNAEFFLDENIAVLFFQVRSTFRAEVESGLFKAIFLIINLSQQDEWFTYRNAPGSYVWGAIVCTISFPFYEHILACRIIRRHWTGTILGARLSKYCLCIYPLTISG